MIFIIILVCPLRLLVRCSSMKNVRMLLSLFLIGQPVVSQLQRFRAQDFEKKRINDNRGSLEKWFPSFVWCVGCSSWSVVRLFPCLLCVSLLSACCLPLAVRRLLVCCLSVACLLCVRSVSGVCLLVVCCFPLVCLLCYVSNVLCLRCIMSQMYYLSMVWCFKCDML